MLLRGWQIKNNNDQLGMLQLNLLRRKQSELLPAVREDPMKIDITKLKITNESLFIEKKNQNSLFEIDDPKFGNLGTISNNWVIKYIY